MKRTLLFVLSLLLTASASWAQSYTLYSTDNSPLPANPLYAVDFDNNGNIWFSGQRNAATGLANVSTLSRDRKTWKVYQPAELALDALEDRVFYTAVDDQNTKWFCTHYGVSFLKADGTAGIVDFTKDKYTRTVQTDAKGNVYISQREDTRTDSRLWVSSDRGATWTPWKLADLGFTTIDESVARPEAYDLREDSKGQLWLCTWFGVTRRTADGSWKSVAALEDKYTYAMTIDPDDHVWVPDNDTADLYEILPDETVIRHDSSSIAPLKFKVIDLEADADGHIWCATNGGGLVEIKPDRSFNQYTAENTGGKIPENSINIIEIREGVIWIATSTSGVVRLGNVASLSTLIKEASPSRFHLLTNYPNPFNPSTTIRFNLPKQTAVELTIYSINGKRVRTLVNDTLPSGAHDLLWDGYDDRGVAVASGVYFCRLSYDGVVFSIKMTLLK